MKENLEKIAGALAKIEKTLIIILLPIMCITILVNTLARITGLFIDRLTWAEEFARYLMIWMAFIGAALVMQEDGHYKMTAIVDVLPYKMGKLVKTAALIALVVFMIILAKVGVDCCIKIAAMGQKSPTLKIPMWIPYAAIPTGMIMGIFQTILREVIRIFKLKEEKGGGQK